MVGWHHRLNGHEFESTLGAGGQGGLACCSPRGRRELDMTEQLKWQPTPVFVPGESQGRGILVAAVYGVTQTRTRLKRCSSRSSSSSSGFCHTLTWFKHFSF